MTGFKKEMTREIFFASAVKSTLNAERNENHITTMKTCHYSRNFPKNTSLALSSILGQKKVLRNAPMITLHLRAR